MDFSFEKVSEVLSDVIQCLLMEAMTQCLTPPADAQCLHALLQEGGAGGGEREGLQLRRLSRSAGGDF